MNINCNCQLCEARKLEVHPLEVYFKNKAELKYVKKFPGHEIYEYEKATKAEFVYDREMTMEEVSLLDHGKLFDEYVRKKQISI